MLINCFYIKRTIKQFLATRHFYNLPFIEVQQLSRNISVSVDNIHKNNILIEAALLLQQSIFLVEITYMINKSSRARMEVL